MSGLAAAQAALVAAVTGTGPVPAGFDCDRLDVARKALLRKRSGEVARSWPRLAGSLGSRMLPEFADWAAHRPTAGGWRDGWDFALHLSAAGSLPAAAELELAERELRWRHRGTLPPRRRRLPRARLVQGLLLVQLGGRIRVLGRGTPG